VSHKNCHDLLDGLSDFIDGEASAALCAEIQRHMTGCKKCRVVVDTLRKTIEFYRQLPGPEMNDNIRERLYKFIDISEFGRK
jgi:RNA polymerase sigma-70 factor, ECF subfamily